MIKDQSILPPREHLQTKIIPIAQAFIMRKR